MNPTTTKRTVAFALSALLFSTSTRAAFEPLPVGGRAAGMGEAYSALVDDVFALYYNPAGVLQLNRPEIGTYYSQLFVGLTDNSEISRMFFGYGQPFGKGGRLGGLGVSYGALNLSGLYREEVYGLTYGQELRRLWNVGGTIKMLRKTVGTDGDPDPLMGRSVSAVGLDFGFQYRLTQAYALAFAARNFNAPDVALGNQTDKAPAVYTAAVARRIRSSALGVELMNWRSVDTNHRLSVGGEHWYKSGFGLRAGGAFGSRRHATASFGASYRMDAFQLDYATVYPLQGVEGTMGIQQVSLKVALGKPPIDPLEQQLLREKEQRVRAETEARYAKAERDRLKRQLMELTEEKEDSAQEAAAAREALRDAQAQEARSATVDPQRQTFENYTRALSDYNSRVQRGIGLAEKKQLLNDILRRFENQGVDTATVQRELRAIGVEEAQAQKDYDLSMTFYQRLVEQGASGEERRGMLDRIIQKYQPTGLNIQAAVEERRSLGER